MSTTISIPETPSPSLRVRWIDVAKGIGIILVSFGHIRNGNGQSVWLPELNSAINIVYLFHMPLFFFLGGLTFSSRRPFPEFLKVKAKTLLVPYYIFSLYFLAKPIAALFSPSLVDSIQANQDYAANIGMHSYNILINGSALWFLWAYFIGELIVYPLSKLLSSHWQYSICGLVLIAGSTTFASCFPSVTLPFCMVKGVEVAGYILIGLTCKQFLSHVHRKPSLLISAALFALLIGTASLAAHIEQRGWRITCNTVGAFIGVAMAVCLSIAIYHNGVLEHIGRHSLSFYVVNAFTLNVGKIVFFKLLGIESTSASPLMQWIYGILLTVFCLALLWVEDIIIRTLIPWSVGLERNRHPQQENDTI